MSELPLEGPRLLTSDGVELATRTWSSDGEPRAIVILVHGLSSTKDHPARRRTGRVLPGSIP